MIQSKQQELFKLSQSIHKHSIMFNIGGVAVFEGQIDVTIFTQSIKYIFDKTDVLSLPNYITVGSIPISEYPIEILNFSRKKNSEKFCIDWMQSHMKKKLDPLKGLIEVKILQSRSSSFLYIKVHHLLFDGFSVALLFNKTAQIYNSLKKGVAPDTFFSINNYQEFIESESIYYSSDEYRKDKLYWSKKLKKTEFSDYFYTGKKSFKTSYLKSKREEVLISNDEFLRISNFCSKNKCTTFHFFITVTLVLNKLLGNKDSMIGIPVFNRRNKKSKNTLGTFVNVLPFYKILNLDLTFVELMLQIKSELRENYKYQRVPLIDILEEKKSNLNLYNATFSYHKKCVFG